MLPQAANTFLLPWCQHGAELQLNVSWKNLLPFADGLPLTQAISAVLYMEGQALWAVDDLRAVPEPESWLRLLLLKDHVPHAGFIVATLDQKQQFEQVCGSHPGIRWWIQSTDPLPPSSSDCSSVSPAPAPIAKAVFDGPAAEAACRQALSELHECLEQLIESPLSEPFEAELSPLVSQFQALQSQVEEGKIKSATAACVELQTLALAIGERMRAATPPSAPAVQRMGAESTGDAGDLGENLGRALSRQVDILEQAESSALGPAVADVLAEFRSELMDCVAIYEQGKYDCALFQLSHLESRGAMIERIVLEQVGK